MPSLFFFLCSSPPFLFRLKTSALIKLKAYAGIHLLCCLYCAFVVLAVLIKLKVTKHEQHAFAHKGASSGSVVNYVVRRIIMYPMTPLLTQLGFIVSEIYLFANVKASYTLNVWGVMTKALPGLFNLIAFLIDPAFASTFKQLKKDMIERYGDGDALSRTVSHHSQMTQMDARTFKTYADNGALDYAMPRTNTAASLAPLSPQDKPNNNQVLRWVVRKVWSKEQLSSPQRHPQQAHEFLSAIPDTYNRRSEERHDQLRQQQMSTATTRPSEEGRHHDYDRPGSLSFLGSPTAYLIGETPYSPSIPYNMPSRERFPSDVSSMPCSPPPFTAVSVDDLDAVVPWRVLEADEEDGDMTKVSVGDLLQQSQRNPGDGITCRNNDNTKSNNDSSWLELNEPESPSVVSQWLTRRGDSFESVRERVARSSKSIRRWRRHHQQAGFGEQDRADPSIPTMADPYSDRRSRALSGSFSEPALEVVPESTLEDTPTVSRADQEPQECQHPPDDDPFIRAF
ncbi:hypothetical protein BCR43DRAFT_561710 [Syncephalastrum racemosum]|uniref:Uncharacterized protein n=1 Tax=Syncephalastrum racemosum TaxID=13706 RepID=A0A1X2HQ54_SYNRA|nr:hypothetical protein BCR43DRAFT_561710 [Syncephalastrum racemosum]